MRPNLYIAKIVASNSATNGSPKKLNTGITSFIAGMTPKTDLQMINTNGIRIIPAIVENEGSFDSSKSA